MAACVDDGTTELDSGTTPSTGTGQDSADITETGDTTDTTDTQPRPAAQLAGDAPVNLLIISVDTFRRDHVGFHGGRDTTPVIDGLMAQGVVLADHAPCANWTYPSVLCSQTGMNSVDLGVHPSVGKTDGAYTYEFPTVDALLKDAGYATALTSANAFFKPSLGTGKDFDHVTVTAQWEADDALANALVQLEALMATGGPWFQHVHLFDPHTPYTAPAEYTLGETADLAPMAYDFSTQAGVDDMLRTWATLSAEDQAIVSAWIDALYAADVRFADAEIGRFLDALDALGGLDDTLVLFWSDHGEQFYEDGRFGHGVDLHDEEADGWAFLWMKDGGLAPAVFTRPTGQIDLLPTVWDLLGLATPDQFQGHVAGMADADQGRLVAHWAQDGTAAMSWQVGTDKLIYRWDGTLELYDRTADASEDQDIAEQHPDRVSALWDELQPEVAKMVEINPLPTAVPPEL